jgi:hypothetical protein
MECAHSCAKTVRSCVIFQLRTWRNFQKDGDQHTKKEGALILSWGELIFASCSAFVSFSAKLSEISAHISWKRVLRAA